MSSLPSSGAISLSQVNVVLGRPATQAINMNDAAVRTLFGVGGSGTSISMSQGYGKANQFAFTISSNQTNANLRTLAVNAGWNQSTRVVATIASGVYISSNGTGTPALTVNGSFPGGVELINNGFIVGMGGNGGNGAGWLNSNFEAGTNGSSGGLALSVGVGISINNAGTIGGGGGGGGGGARGAGIFGFFGYPELHGAGGGGGGGGRATTAANSGGGAGGRGVYPYGDGRGLQFGQAGGGGTVNGAGGGGAGGWASGGNFASAGGGGGNWGSAGAGGNGGGDGGNTSAGSGGNAISGNGNITWLAFGTRLGGIG